LRIFDGYPTLLTSDVALKLFILAPKQVFVGVVNLAVITMTWVAGMSVFTENSHNINNE
jgi:hypothetical protein